VRLIVDLAIVVRSKSGHEGKIVRGLKLREKRT
jgi:hypothetical protein